MINSVRKFKVLVLLIVVLPAVLASTGEAAGRNDSGAINSQMMNGGSMMTSSGSFNMMGGMAGGPVVDSIGTAYLVSYNPASDAGAAPSSSSFQSTIIAFDPSGSSVTVSLKGIVSRPVIYGNYLVATATMPDFSNYTMAANNGSNPASSQSVLYALTLPMTSSSVPVAVSLDGSFASMPVIANNRIYVTTTDFGNAMMSGSSTFSSIYGSYNFNASGSAKTYLYIINFDGSVAAKIVVQ